MTGALKCKFLFKYLNSLIFYNKLRHNNNVVLLLENIFYISHIIIHITKCILINAFTFFTD